MTAILVTLVVYKVALLAIGLWAKRFTRDRGDMYLGGRSLGPAVAALSAAASSSSAWTLLGVSGLAFQKGLSACWLFPACVGGFAVNWFVLAPRLRRRSAEQGSWTLTEVLAGPPDTPGRRPVVLLASVITLSCLLTYVATQLNGAGKSFEAAFDGTPLTIGSTTAILVGAVIVVAYTMLGGFWAVSLTDTLQGTTMVLAAVALPVAGLWHVGGFGALFDRLHAIEQDSWFTAFGGLPVVPGLLMVVGLTGITMGYPGQPHVVNWFMALADERALRRARSYGMAWAVLVYSGMIVTGWCARATLTGAPGYDRERAFFDLGKLVFPEVIFGVLLAAVLSAVMSTVDSQLLVSTSTVNHHLGGTRGSPRQQILLDRLVILGLCAAATLAAITVDKRIFDMVLFAWSGCGAAFGPLLLWILWRGPVPSRVSFATMLTGFATCVIGFAGSDQGIGLWNLYGFERNFLPYFAATLVLVALAPRRRQ